MSKASNKWFDVVDIENGYLWKIVIWGMILLLKRLQISIIVDGNLNLINHSLKIITLHFEKGKHCDCLISVQIWYFCVVDLKPICCYDIPFIVNYFFNSS